jgi:hypothetical protein
MDRMASSTKTKPLEQWQLGANWKAATLADLHPHQHIRIVRDKLTIETTVYELLKLGMPPWVTLAQVEWAFHTPDEPDEKIIPIWRKKLPNGRR